MENLKYNNTALHAVFGSIKQQQSENGLDQLCPPFIHFTHYNIHDQKYNNMKNDTSFSKNCTSSIKNIDALKTFHNTN